MLMVIGLMYGFIRSWFNSLFHKYRILLLFLHNIKSQSIPIRAKRSACLLTLLQFTQLQKSLVPS